MPVPGERVYIPVTPPTPPIPPFNAPPKAIPQSTQKVVPVPLVKYIYLECDEDKPKQRTASVPVSPTIVLVLIGGFAIFMMRK